VQTAEQVFTSGGERFQPRKAQKTARAFDRVHASESTGKDRWVRRRQSLHVGLQLRHHLQALGKNSFMISSMVTLQHLHPQCKPIRAAERGPPVGAVTNGLDRLLDNLSHGAACAERPCLGISEVSCQGGCRCTGRGHARVTNRALGRWQP